ncbi:CPBP family intramembrane metalloprotease [Anabaena sp. FACHB-1237]|uniref:CPBP family intramembrane glutamic endopeptidase n=1 Tax=Anabaena sp. FACHB-1237 TaxID=2692769 RepID=UPI0016807CDD|nr:type II CAAX endopeptidase family protein [Anabaena sp. FACHB-1237]MBD2137198.1 CPBP family intramembrane metalloprotease [Anabaena sp. FACHB-1237]
MFLLLSSQLFLQPLANGLRSFLQDTPVVSIMAFFAIWVMCWLPLVAILFMAFKWEFNKFLQLKPEQKIPLLVSLYILVPVILWGYQQLNLGSFTEYGLVAKLSLLSSLLLGLSLGIIGIVVVFFLQYICGWCYLETANLKLIPAISLPIFFVALFVGGIEELVFRGFLWTKLQEMCPIWLAAIISSLVFAVLHLVWEQTETIPQLPGLWLMGMVLVFARIVDNNYLGIAWGLHAGWVWAIAIVDTSSIISYTDKITDWVTGKYKKPLAGLAGVSCLLTTAGVLYLL